jgi:hypothetical protein
LPDKYSAGNPLWICRTVFRKPGTGLAESQKNDIETAPKMIKFGHKIKLPIGSIYNFLIAYQGSLGIIRNPGGNNE